MASSSFGPATAAAAAAASLKQHPRKSYAYLPLRRHFAPRANSDKVSFPLSSKGLQFGWNSPSVVKSQLNKVGQGGTPKAAASSPSETKDVKSTTLATEESITGFIAQVATLIKLVDSKDIVELEMKQLDCEILIRKKEALPQPPSPPATYVQSQPQPAVLPPPSAPSSAPASTPAPSPPKAQPSKSSHPPLKCPMAGTFYQSPGPGEPPFVKVGDKVKKGQVICIIEAMKLMNEIEADQSGTVVEVIAKDGKPVSIDSPLFVIEP